MARGCQESEDVKLGHNLVNHVMTELEVNCLPSDLPEFIEIDLSGLKPKATLIVSDIKLPKGVKYVAQGKVNPVVVSAVPPLVAEETEAAAEGAAAPAADAKAAAKTHAKGDAKAPAKKK